MKINWKYLLWIAGELIEAIVAIALVILVARLFYAIFI